MNVPAYAFALSPPPVTVIRYRYAESGVTFEFGTELESSNDVDDVVPMSVNDPGAERFITSYVAAPTDC